MGIAFSDGAKGLLDRPNFAHLATLMSDGSPHSAPVWVGRENDLLVVCTDADSLKGKNTQRDPALQFPWWTLMILTRNSSFEGA
jgi:pyridoxine/pyridoxamine 5'-phosphate oxidase